MKCPHCNRPITDEGRAKGGRVSRRTLTPNQARKMVEARERKRNERKTK